MNGILRRIRIRSGGGKTVRDRAQGLAKRRDRGGMGRRPLASALIVLALWAQPAGARPDDLTQAVEAVRAHNATRADIQVIARSAHAGNGAACELVAWMLATGTSVDQDRRLAFSWYIESYRRGMRQSLRDARIVFDRMNFAERASVDSRLLVFLKTDPPPPDAVISPRADSATAKAVREVVREEAARASFPPQLAEAVAFVESRFTPGAVSPKGARGVMQIMPSTAAGFSTDADALFDTRTNIRLGIKYLSQLIDQYGSYDKALANYVGGTAAGAAYPFVTDEVRLYVDNVLNQTAHYEQDPDQTKPAERSVRIDK
jgi:soluble lytic murein transglycosylase-like protein